MEGSVVDVFESGAYWREYYTSLGHENREVGRFLAEVTRKISPGGGLRILDAGCGPTLLYWGVFAAGRNELYGFDLSHANIADTHRRIEAARAGIVDGGLIEAARHALTLFGGTETAEERVADKARQVVSVKVADLSKPWPYAAEMFDLVQCCFAIEALADWDAFHRALAEAHLVLRPGGVLVMANTAHGNGWTCDSQHIRTLFVTGEDLRWHLADAGFALETLRDIQSSDVSWRDQGYSRVLLSQAVKA
jgi:SAM-dependent methyltransferase